MTGVTRHVENISDLTFGVQRAKGPGVTSRCGAFGIALLFYNKLFTVADVNALR